MTIAISLYSFGVEKEYSSFPVDPDGLAEARDLLGREMARGHSYRVAPWQFGGGHADAADARRLVLAGDVNQRKNFASARQV